MVHRNAAIGRRRIYARRYFVVAVTATDSASLAMSPSFTPQ